MSPSPERLLAWLRAQHDEHLTAAERIERECLARAPAGWRVTLGVIASQERKHAAWVGELLRARGEEPRRPDRPERDRPAPGSNRPFEDAAAAAHRAERARVGRIRAIAHDPTAPADVRAVFRRLLREGIFRARAFAEMAGETAGHVHAAC